MKRGDVPTGVKIISILYHIGAAASTLAALALIISGIVLVINPGLLESAEGLPDFVGSIGNVGLAVLVMGVLAALIAILEFFVAKGLHRGKRWARILVIIFVIAGIVSGVGALFGGNGYGAINLILFLFVGYYMLFNKEAKEFFS